MKIENYTLLFFICGQALVLRMSERPKNFKLLQFATLVIPPNDVDSMKDRFGLFTPDAYLVLNESEALMAFEEFQERAKTFDVVKSESLTRFRNEAPVCKADTPVLTRVVFNQSLQLYWDDVTCSWVKESDSATHFFEPSDAHDEANRIMKRYNDFTMQLQIKSFDAEGKEVR